MSLFDDDALRAMLLTRADRLSASAASDVLAGVHEEIRRPRQGGALAVLSVLTGRAPVIGAGWAAAAMIAVLVMVVVATRSPTASPSPAAPASAAVVAPSAVASAAPSPLPTPVPSNLVQQPTHLSVSALPQALRDGSLDGRLVLVDSTLRIDRLTLRGCLPAPCTPPYELDLVGPVVTGAQPSLPIVPATPDVNSVPLTGTFVVVPWRGSLVLVGRLEGSLAKPVSWTTFAHAYAPPSPGGEIGLQPVSGWLTRNVVLPCPSHPSGSSPCGPVDQLSDGPGGPATIPRVDEPALGITQAVHLVKGPFLVRTGTGIRLEIVARYDVGSYAVVDVPPVTCDLASGTSLPPCGTIADQAIVALAMAAGGAITSVEVEQGAYCPPGWACPTVEPDRAHAIIHTTLGDWLVQLVYGPDGALTDTSAGPLPTP